MHQQKAARSGQDVVSFLKGQHEQVKELFGKVIASEGSARGVAFRDLTQLLKAHEAGEEAIVHPEAARSLPAGDEIVADRLAEEKKANAAIAKLNKLDVESKDFEKEFSELRAAVLKHAEREEKEEFSKLAKTLDERKLQEMRASVETVEAKARKSSS